ncbi:MAG: hypothetical protein BWY72_02171 [Bacteroidetes bacterium ADurb.Bin416]|nr:MAG: hypothetical protein BWY72_02171 [Bacteroidetes bacterium ADurb.Bin416]
MSSSSPPGNWGISSTEVRGFSSTMTACSSKSAMSTPCSSSVPLTSATEIWVLVDVTSSCERSSWPSSISSVVISGTVNLIVLFRGGCGAASARSMMFSGLSCSSRGMMSTISLASSMASCLGTNFSMVLISVGSAAMKQTTTKTRIIAFRWRLPDVLRILKAPYCLFLSSKTISSHSDEFILISLATIMGY